jgi:amino acid permease
VTRGLRWDPGTVESYAALIGTLIGAGIFTGPVCVSVTVIVQASGRLILFLPPFALPGFGLTV